MFDRLPTAVKIMAVAAMFLAAPLLVYEQLDAAAEDNNRQLADSIETQGRLAAEALRPWLTAADGDGLDRAATVVAQLAGVGPDVKLLFRPQGEREAFYYVAAAPAIPAAALEREQRELDRLGVLDRLRDGCEAARAPARRFTDADGVVVLLTSVTPVLTPAGCWVVITADRSPEALASALGRPYWTTPAVRSAAAIYLAMAAAVIAVLTQIWLGLRRFARLARQLRQLRPSSGETGRPISFAAGNRVAELAGVAAEFDRMVAALGAGADALRLAAHETAHAFKTPLAAIGQSLEPLRRRAAGDSRCERSLALIDKALERLDCLVAASRSLDEALADTIDPPRDRVDLSALTAAMAAEYAQTHDPAQVRFIAAVEPGCAVAGAVGLLEIVLQNLLDNAVSFSPAGGAVIIRLHATRRTVELRVEDQGPGADPESLPRLFDRYVSLRGDRRDNPGHFGLGLWIVRRNIEALGGAVTAANRPDGGFQATITLPRSG